jgi:hypothetical protein
MKVIASIAINHDEIIPVTAACADKHSAGFFV